MMGSEESTRVHDGQHGKHDGSDEVGQVPPGASPSRSLGASLSPPMLARPPAALRADGFHMAAEVCACVLWCEVDAGGDIC